jgi:hypothetical protein
VVTTSEHTTPGINSLRTHRDLDTVEQRADRCDAVDSDRPAPPFAQPHSA